MFGSIVSVMMIIALVLAIILGFSLRQKFEDMKLRRDVDQAIVEEQLRKTQ